MSKTLRGEIVNVFEEPDGRLFLTVKPEDEEGLVSLHLRISEPPIPQVGDLVEYELPQRPT